MCEQERLTPDERDFQAALGALMPLGPDLEFQKIWMEAQHRKWRTQVFVWRGVAAALAAGLILSLLLRPQGHAANVHVDPVEPVRQANQHSPLESTPVGAPEPLPVLLSGDDYLSLRSRVVAFGVSALPPPTHAAGTLVPMRPLDASNRSLEPQADIKFLGPLWRGGHS